MSENPSEIESVVSQIKSTDNIVTRAKLIAYLKQTKKISVGEIARLLNTNSPYVCNVMRILRLNTMVLDSYYSKTVSASHLMVISRIRDQAQQSHIFETVLREGLTVGLTEQLVRKVLYNVATEGGYVDQKVIDKIRQTLSSVDDIIDVNVVQTRRRARVEIVARGSLKTTSQILKKIALGLNITAFGGKDS